MTARRPVTPRPLAPHLADSIGARQAFIDLVRGTTLGESVLMLRRDGYFSNFVITEDIVREQRLKYEVHNGVKGVKHRKPSAKNSNVK